VEHRPSYTGYTTQAGSPCSAPPKHHPISYNSYQVFPVTKFPQLPSFLSYQVYQLPSYTSYLVYQVYLALRCAKNIYFVILNKRYRCKLIYQLVQRSACATALGSLFILPEGVVIGNKIRTPYSYHLLDETVHIMSFYIQILYSITVCLAELAITRWSTEVTLGHTMASQHSPQHSSLDCAGTIMVVGKGGGETTTSTWVVTVTKLWLYCLMKLMTERTQVVTKTDWICTFPQGMKGQEHQAGDSD
jgi:hypothetical protein